MPKDLKKKDKQGLTPKQKVVFEVIRDFIKQNGVAPSYEELKQLIGSKSKSHVHGFVHQLMQRGWIGEGYLQSSGIYVL